MIINEELFEIEKKCQLLVERIQECEAMQAFQQAKTRLKNSPAAQAKITAFQETKMKMEQIAPFGEFAPGYRELRQKLFQMKREMDLEEEVYQYRMAERQLQIQLDLIAKKLASSVSENILVSAGDPFSLSVIGLPAACEIHLGKRKDIEL